MRLIMATRRTALDIEAEPVQVEVDAEALTLTLDDGDEIVFDVRELEQAIDGERAPGGRQAA
jgi:hypothetical protein